MSNLYIPLLKIKFTDYDTRASYITKKGNRTK
jgi:hypothetical protein